MLTRIRRIFKQKKPSLQERYPQYTIGRHSYGDLKVRQWGEGAELQIGAFCSFASGVKIFLGGEHRVDWVTTFPFPALWKCDEARVAGHPHSKGDVIIGNDVWAGTEAVILSGVHVGDGAVIGARAVVTRDIPPYAIVAGNPARIIRMRFEPSQIARLLAVRWWTWDDEKIRSMLPFLLSDDISGFLAEGEGK